MPGKSRHSHRKKLQRSKKGKSTPIAATTITQQEAVAQSGKPVVSPKVIAPSSSVSALTSARYPFVVAELRRIGILAGIMLVILIILSFVLS